MLNVTGFANALAMIVIIFHPIIYFLIKKWPGAFTYFVRLATLGVIIKPDGFDLSFKNMLIGTLFKTILFWAFGFFLASFYNMFIS
ncbi:MAG: hypothetical protein A3C50_01270 [Candidatus Staskawiczbacteria bacterium RIFCSPHIGHO2_02_FULL_43_16]|uniref:Uncharacterized protein n=1 Tax=Candidatus Staskawiczbacteria bacterium RIFCSPHIGHO2_01_FULL_41_41 TaxID=1802203 RepID=A0A1G2HVR3_9BACT|nr:MAG: hypothetical protein A2822_04645 [Candidatus Staskawiczbacteria bacterium RIFCSPHIGHO2_01_FULL_41_41]OGZ68838.1 MAG: hypothetical protein A3C50_01270 [Candidatus Staskawiczbacteria bacterium RIFCSPHIGHO2_02_FULL_43_16]OGZ74211.1 MAG: hypothetical protein A3A12_00260 [Candidatus Staskawiczbacteria bacterium RIFCSPLOWO2_01_FULL_43_17b]